MVSDFGKLINKMALVLGEDDTSKSFQNALILFDLHKPSTCMMAFEKLGATGPSPLLKAKFKPQNQVLFMCFPSLYFKLNSITNIEISETRISCKY